MVTSVQAALTDRRVHLCVELPHHTYVLDRHVKSPPAFGHLITHIPEGSSISEAMNIVM